MSAVIELQPGDEAAVSEETEAAAAPVPPPEALPRPNSLEVGSAFEMVALKLEKVRDQLKEETAEVCDKMTRVAELCRQQNAFLDQEVDRVKKKANTLDARAAELIKELGIV